MSLENIKDLFEVTKTVHFELKPSKKTKIRIPKAADSSKYLSDTRLFLEKSREVIEQIDTVLKRLRSGEIEDIEVGKDFLKHLDPIRFKNKKDDTSGTMSLKKVLNNDFGLGFQEVFNEKIDMLRKGFAMALSRDITVSRSEFINQTKSDEIRAMKRTALVIKKADLFLTGGETTPDLQPLRIMSKKVVEYLLQWQVYRSEQKDFFEACSAAYRSTKANGEIEWKKCGMNARALFKKDVVEKLKSNMDSAWEKFEKFSSEKRDLADQISQWNELHSREKTNEEERIKKQGKTGTELNDELEKWREKFSDYKFGDSSEGKIHAITLKTKKIDASRNAGSAKQKFQAFEEEYFRQQTLDYFSVLLRKNGKYYLAMIDKESKDTLEKLPSGNSAEALSYRSLTFKALTKYAEKQKSFDMKLAEKCRFSKEKAQKYQPTLSDLIRYVDLLANSLKRMNQEEGNGFTWSETELLKIIQDGDIEKFRIFVNENCYRKEWRNIDWNSVVDLENQDTFFLFQLYCQDFAMDLDFAMDERDQNRAKKGVKEESRENLHTRYWRDCFEKNLKHIHVAPESRIFLRPKKKDEDLNSDQGKLRFREEKITIDFQLVFYPEKKMTSIQANDAIVKQLADAGVKAFIGIDRGENSLANYYVLNLDGSIMKDESGNALKGDLTYQNTLGEFVDIERIEKIGKGGKRSKYEPNLKGLLNDLGLPKNAEKPGSIDWTSMDFESLLVCRDKLNDAYDPKNLKLIDKNYPNGSNKDIDKKTGKPRPVWVFDHRYAMDHARLLQRVIYEMWMKKEMQEMIKLNQSTESVEQIRFVSQLLSSRELRSGYVGTFVHRIAELIEKYQAVVVFENLNEGYEKGAGEEENFLSGITEEGQSPKEKSILKGISVYQMLEERLIRKLNYHVVKTDKKTGNQLTPKIPNLTLLRNIPVEEIKNQDVIDMKNAGMTNQIGCVLYVDEKNTSKSCPECGFVSTRDKSIYPVIKKDATGLMMLTFEVGSDERIVFGKMVRLPGTEYRINGSSQYITQSNQRCNLWKRLDEALGMNVEYNLLDIVYKDEKGYFGAIFNLRDKSKGDRVMCPCCGFDTESHQYIKSGDEVAAYNIAKRGMELFKSKKMTH